VDGILFTLFGAGVVPPASLAIRGSLVGLLDPAQHLLIERSLEALGRIHDCSSVGVLGLQVADDFLAGLLPQPEVVVNERVAVDRRGLGRLLGYRRPGDADVELGGRRLPER